MIKKLFTPFRKLTGVEQILSIIIIFVLIMFIWSKSESQYIPSPIEVAKAFPALLGKDLVRSFGHSISVCLSAIWYSLLISISIAYLSIFPIFSQFCEFLRKFRFLPSTGLSFVFMKLSVNYGSGIESQMSWMMIFGITTWLIYSLVGIILEIEEKEILYAKSLGLNYWEQVREIVIKGKADKMFLAVIGVFAIAWMMLPTIENISKASGGIGVLLSDSNKYYKFDQVYALQILILLTGIGIDFLLFKIKDWIFPYSKN